MFYYNLTLHDTNRIQKLSLVIKDLVIMAGYTILKIELKDGKKITLFSVLTQLMFRCIRAFCIRFRLWTDKAQDIKLTFIEHHGSWLLLNEVFLKIRGSNNQMQ